MAKVKIKDYNRWEETGAGLVCTKPAPGATLNKKAKPSKSTSKKGK